MTEQDYYELLDVPPGATADEIREAVAAQRRYWTPLVNHQDRERQYEAQRSLDQLEQAYETLTDPARRASYDETLRQAKRHTGRQPASSAPSPADRAPDWPCPECNEVNPRSSQACVRCGAALTKVCPECRNSMYVTHEFCGECASNYEEARAHYEKAAAQAAMEAEKAVQAAQQAKGKRDVEAAKRAAGQAEAAAGRAQDAAARAETERARGAASTASRTAARAEVLSEETVALIEETEGRARRWVRRFAGLLVLAWLVLALLPSGTLAAVIWLVLLVVALWLLGFMRTARYLAFWEKALLALALWLLWFMT